MQKGDKLSNETSISSDAGYFNFVSYQNCKNYFLMGINKDPYGIALELKIVVLAFAIVFVEIVIEGGF